jgi:hypothetical protein
MSKKGDVVKAIAKKPAPKSTYGTDPNEPWSAKAGIAENITSRRASVLARFLKAKGYNPSYISKDQKDAHAKTGEFNKWKRDHGIYEEDDVNEDFTTKINQPEIRSRVADSPTLKRKKQLDKAAKHNAVKPGASPRTGAIQREDNFSDPKSATQAPFDAATCPNDVMPEKKRTSRAASMVKEIYKRSRSLEEGLYDWEKDSKEKQGSKKPTLSEPKTQSKEEGKMDARLVLKGGTTMTGQKRDVVEIDPMMKNRGKFPDYVDTTKQTKTN